MVRFVVAMSLLLSFVTHSGGQDDFDAEPINYRSCVPADRVAKLNARISAGDAKLTWDERFGWLPSLLKQLEIPESSQTLVFSKTSMQFRRITPQRPRAVYFNDDAYVGWVRNGEVIELSAVDPKQGAIFYTVEQKRETPAIQRTSGQCMACHATRRTEQVPGFLVRSVFPQGDGQPDFRLGSETTDHTTPFAERFGGWYVTGQHGTMRHRGNVVLPPEMRNAERATDMLDREAGANQPQLPEKIRDAYLQPTSDIVALMLLEHQSQLHNRITRASYTARKAMHDQASMNRILERPAEFVSETTERRIHSAADDLVEYLLFRREFELTARVSGREDFTETFASNNRQSSNGRSLRELDLSKRLLRYPCSYLIYSESFRSLPQPILKRVKERFETILSGEDHSDDFAHLSSDDRRNILEILTATHPLFMRK